jgi:hypothetical protein
MRCRYFWSGYGVAAGQLTTGRIKALAVAHHERLLGAPDLPTTKEVGVPSVILSNWWGLATAKGTDPAVISRIAVEFKRVLDLPATQSFLIRQGFVSVGNSPEQFARELVGEAQEWQVIVNKAGTKLDRVTATSSGRPDRCSMRECLEFAACVANACAAMASRCAGVRRLRLLTCITMRGFWAKVSAWRTKKSQYRVVMGQARSPVDCAGS